MKNARRSSIAEAALVPIAAALTVWIARFWYCGRFGLYEDDWGRVPHAMMSSWSSILGNGWELLLGFGGQGRPLHPNLIHLFSWLGNELGGLTGIYWVAWAIVSCNAILFYFLLRRISTHRVLAVTGALAYALFPADTNQAYLTTALGSQPSLTFFLVATHCYLSRSAWLRRTSYFLILASLFCYETVFLLFLAVPLLRWKWDRHLRRRWIVHAALLCGMLCAAFLLRKFTGEAFVSDLGLATALTRPILQMAVGSAFSFLLFFYRSFETWKLFDWTLLLFQVPCALGFGWIVQRAVRSDSDNGPPRFGRWREWLAEPDVIRFVRETGKLAAVGAALLVLAYPLTFTVPATETLGRSTRVHLAAVVGVSLLAACLFATFLYVARSLRRERLAATVLGLLLSGLVGFGVTIQRDYALSWQYQRALWSDIVRLCPDLEDRTVILLDERGLRETRFILSRGWAFARKLRLVYGFPGEWVSPPVVHTLLGSWEQLVDRTGDLQDGIHWRSGQKQTVDDPRFIFLHPRGGRLRRLSGRLLVDSREFELARKPEPIEPVFNRSAIYRYLILPPDEEAVSYVTERN